MEEIDLSHQCLETVPIFHLQRHALSDVTEMNLSGNFLTDLTDQMEQCTSLNRLHLEDNQFKTIPRQVYRLPSLTMLSMDGNCIDQLPPEIRQCKSLELLDLRSNNLETLPKELGELKNLKKFEVRMNKLRQLPASIGDCHMLTSLNISANRLQSLPTQLSDLSKLEELDASMNILQTVPEEISDCKSLKQLILWSNEISYLPPNLSNLKHLRELDLYKNKLGNFPDAIGGLIELERLSLRHNRINFIPKSIGNLNQLKELRLHDNAIKELPPEIGLCKKLKILTIQRNQLSALPADLGKLHNLQELILHDNSITELLPEIANCTQLKSLKLSYNKIKQLPESIGKLQKLKLLDLAGNCIHELPAEIGNCTALECLNVKENMLQELPIQIGNLEKLRSLDMYKNILIRLPHSLGGCRQLEHICVKHNQMKHLPREIGCLSNLRKLDAQKNRLLSIPKEIGQLIELEELCLQWNQLKNIPQEICKLQKLKYLHLYKNELTILPGTVGQLKYLKKLNVSYNKLKDLPESIANLKHLTELTVFLNPLSIPPSVLEKGTEGILNYLSKLQDDDHVINRNRNLMMVGPTLAGKTSFVNCIKSKKADPTEAKDRTFVVERHKEKNAANSLEVQILDFGGQASYNPSSSLFWTQNTIFAITVDLNKYDKTEKPYKSLVSSWVQLVCARVPGAAVAFIGTHTDLCSEERVKGISDEIIASAEKEENDTTLLIQKKIKETSNQTDVNDCTKLLERRPVLLKKVLAVSCVNYCGIENAWEYICTVLEDENIFKAIKVPKSWTNLQSRIYEAQPEGSVICLTMGQVQQLAQTDGIDNGWLEECLDYLQSCGDIIRNKHHTILREYIFHNPDELICMLKAILAPDLTEQLKKEDNRFRQCTDTELICAITQLKEKGLLDIKMAKAVLEDFVSSNEDFNILITLLVQFDIVFSVCGQNGTIEQIGIPTMLPKEQPDDVKWPTIIPTNLNQVNIHISFGTTTPLNFFGALYVRLQTKWLHSIGWQNGTYISIDGTKLQIEIKNTHLEICARGDDLNNIWSMILTLWEEIKKILEPWQGLIWSKHVVCPACVRKQAVDAWKFKGDWIEHPCPHKEHFCHTCKGNIPTGKLYPAHKDLATWNARYTREHLNYWKYSQLIHKTALEMLRRILAAHIKPYKFSEWVKEREDTVKKKFGGTFKWMRRKLLPEKGEVTLNDLDLTVLINIFSKMELAVKEKDDIRTLGELRGNLAHNPQSDLVISDEDFQQKWPEGEALILRLGGDQMDIDCIKDAKPLS